MDVMEIPQNPKRLKCFSILDPVSSGFPQYNAILTDALHILDTLKQIHLKLITMQKWLFNTYPEKSKEICV